MAISQKMKNEAFTLDRPLTPEEINANYNNFYEFSTSKHIDASGLKIRPWTVKLDGLVEGGPSLGRLLGLEVLITAPAADRGDDQQRRSDDID